jgi:hypothetical protein
MLPMILLYRWTLADTLATLSHPERKPTPEIHTANENVLKQRAREEAQRRAYANAYKELQDELNTIWTMQRTEHTRFSID